MLENDKDEPRFDPAAETLAGAQRPEGAPSQSHLMPTQQGPPVQSTALTREVGLAATEAAGRYTNATEYGRGGMGRVLLVHDTFLSRDVALKELITETDSAGQTVVNGKTAAESAHFLQRFLREARITGNLEHPSIVPVYELGRRPNGGHYYTMKLVRGRTLHRAIRDARNLEERLKLLPHVIDLCNAIAYAHSKGIIHRDIKPANVMVGSYGETVVIDWGLARVLDQEDPYAAALDVPLSGDTPDEAGQTMAGVPVGTPQYMSPEQAAGNLEQVGTRSDVYALGVVLYEVLAGRTPFTGTRSRDVLRQVLNTKPAPVTSHEPGVPRALARICATAMARNPQERFGSAAELADELVRFSTGALVQSYDYNFLELARHYYRQNKALCNSVLASAAVVLIVVVVAYANILAANQRERLQRQAAEAEAYRANIQVVANDVKNQNFQNAREQLLLQPPHLRDWEWGLLFAQCHEDYATGTGHTDRVYTLIGAPKTDRLISIGEDNRAIVWSTPKLEKQFTFETSEAPGIVADLTEDERYVLISQMGEAVKIYDFENYTLLRTFEFDGLSILNAAISGDGARLAVGTQDGTLIIADAANGSEIRRVTGFGQGLHVLAMNHSGSTVLTLDESNETTLFDVQRGTPLVEIPDSQPRTPENRKQFTVVHGDYAELYDMDSGERRYQGRKVVDFFESAFPSADGRFLATLEDGETIRIWDTESGAQAHTFDLASPWRVLGLNRTGDRLAVATRPNAVEIWDVARGVPVSRFLGHSHPVEAGAFDTGGEFYFTAAGDAHVKAWRHQPVIKENPDGESVTDLAWSKEAGLVAAATLHGTVHFLNDKDFSNVLTVTSHDPFTFTQVDFHPDGERAAVLFSQSLILELGLPAGEIHRRYSDNASVIRTFAYSPKGDVLATGYEDSTIWVWPSHAEAKPLVFNGHESDITSLAFLNDDRRIASGDRSGNVHIWDRRSGMTELEFSFQGSQVVKLVASSVDDAVICALSDGTVRVIRPDRDVPIHTMKGFGDRVQDVALSDSGDRLFATSQRGTLRIWDLATGQDLLEPDSSFTRRASIQLTRSAILVGGERSALGVYPALPFDSPMDGPALANSISLYKESRINYSATHQLPLSSGDALVLVSEAVIVDAIDRLRAMDVHLSPQYVEPRWNPLASLAIKADDIVLMADGKNISSSSVLINALQQNTESLSEQSDGLNLEVLRSGNQHRITCRLLSANILEDRRTISRDDAHALLQGTSTRLSNFRQVFLEFSQRIGRVDGVKFSGAEDLDGIWVPPPATPEDASTLREFGIMQRDRITTLDGHRITSFDGLLKDLHDASRALENGWNGTVEIGVERNKFQHLTLRLTVN